MAEAGTWPTIARDGLLSTTALLDRFGFPSGPERFAIESCRRPQSVTITHPVSGETAVIRDNKVLREAALALHLTDGMTPPEWYETLNRRSFFWVSETRLQRLLGGRAYRGRPHDVITVDTERLVASSLERISLAPINTGFAQADSSTADRGPGTFKRIQDYPLEEYVRWRGNADAIVELAVDYAVANIEEFTIRVERRANGTETQVLWES